MKKIRAVLHNPDRGQHNPFSVLPGKPPNIVIPTGYYCDFTGVLYVTTLIDEPVTVIGQYGTATKAPGCTCPEYILVEGIPAAIRALPPKWHATAIE